MHFILISTFLPESRKNITKTIYYNTVVFSSCGSCNMQWKASHPSKGKVGRVTTTTWSQALWLKSIKHGLAVEESRGLTLRQTHLVHPFTYTRYIIMHLGPCARVLRYLILGFLQAGEAFRGWCCSSFLYKPRPRNLCLYSLLWC